MNIRQLLKATAMSTVGLIGTCSSLYTVGERDQVVVTRMGKPVHVIVGSATPGQEDPTRLEQFEAWNRKQAEPIGHVSGGAGLYVKIPLIDRVHTIPDQLLTYDSAPTDIVTRDKKHLLVDNYAPWRAVNPLLYMQKVVTVHGAQSKLDDLIYSVIRDKAGANDLIELVRSTNDSILTAEGQTAAPIHKGREAILQEITAGSDTLTLQYGIHTADVRIKRADLPQENAKHVYERMQAERGRIAKQYRSQGEEEAIKIRAETDRQKLVISSGAYREAERIRGEGDGAATRIYAHTYSEDPDFYQFWRTMQAYPTAFSQGSTHVVMDPKTDFNQYLAGPSGNARK